MLAEPCGAVTRALHPSPNHFRGRRLALADQSQKSQQVDEERGGVQGPAVLAGGVVGREHVVVIVEALATRAERDARIFPRVYAPVVWPVAPQVCQTVDRPGNVEDGDVAQDSAREERGPRALGPVVDWHDGRKHETQQYHRRHVQSVHNRRRHARSVRHRLVFC